MEHAGKDTQLLLEAQSDLLLAAQPKEPDWLKYRSWIILGVVGLAILGVFLWKILTGLKSACQ
ncbi:MAG: hypothetical protein V7785_12170 [Bermanella sp.]